MGMGQNLWNYIKLPYMTGGITIQLYQLWLRVPGTRVLTHNHFTSGQEKTVPRDIYIPYNMGSQSELRIEFPNQIILVVLVVEMPIYSKIYQLILMYIPMSIAT